MLRFKDNSPRLLAEWRLDRTTVYGEKLREDLKEAALDVALYASTKHGVDLTITCILSTPEEDAALKRKSTTHSGADRELDAGQGGRAVDVRAKDLPPAVREDILRYANESWAGGGNDFCVLHGEGDSLHFHLQASRGVRLAKIERHLPSDGRTA